MQVINIHEAKTHLSRILAEVEAGKSVLLARSGKPIAKLSPYQEEGQPEPGLWRGRIRMDPDFDNEDARIDDLFTGRES
jgi:prevent-host-death family protein